MKKNNPIRMCIMCKTRDLQINLKRLQHKDDSIIKYTKQHRSFYLCNICLIDKKKIQGLIYRFKLKNIEKDQFVQFLKEID